MSGLSLEFSKRSGEVIRLDLRRVLAARRTAYQQLEIVDTASFGRALFLDGKVQSAELDEFVYHEALVQPAMALHPRPERVLVIGGGEGATLREALRHPTVKRAVMVDIDAEAVAACREYLPAWHQGAFADPRVELLHRDARGYLEETSELFDVIIVDVTDPLAGGPAYRLFTQEFYRLARGHLGAAGAIAVQAESADLGVLEPHLA
ncbi:MAG: methyltransferase domain-containing protein, partial [Chloroflexi bacterium]|nr:methyltransferase domain-containing protein [Chloroflexota bacterium]